MSALYAFVLIIMRKINSNYFLVNYLVQLNCFQVFLVRFLGILIEDLKTNKTSFKLIESPLTKEIEYLIHCTTLSVFKNKRFFTLSLYVLSEQIRQPHECEFKQQKSISIYWSAAYCKWKRRMTIFCLTLTAKLQKGGRIVRNAATCHVVRHLALPNYLSHKRERRNRLYLP